MLMRLLSASLPPEDELDDDERDHIEAQARLLYGLVHARYIVTSRGLSKMVCNRAALQGGLLRTTANLARPFAYYALGREIQARRVRAMPSRSVLPAAAAACWSLRPTLPKSGQTLLPAMRGHLQPKE